MTSTGSYTPFYKDAPSYPPLGIQYQKVSPYIDVSGAPVNKSVVFKCPPGAGFMYDASVAFVATVAATTDEVEEGLVGINLVREIQWEVNGQPIVHKTKNAILAQVLTCKDEAKRTHAIRYAQMLGNVPSAANFEKLITAGTDTSYLTYLPLFESFLSKPEKALLLNQVKELNLRITFDTTLASGLKNAITSLTSTMYVQTYMPKLSVYNEMVLKDWSAPFVMECVNHYEEVGSLTAGASTGTTYTLTVPFLVFKTNIFVRENSSDANLSFLDISTISMNLGGVQFLDNMPVSRMNSCASKNGVSSLGVSGDTGVVYDDAGIITIDWGVLCGDGSMNSGTMFADELRGSNITLSWTSTDTTTYSLYVEHMYYQGVQYSPSSGGGNLSVISNN